MGASYDDAISIKTGESINTQRDKASCSDEVDDKDENDGYFIFTYPSKAQFNPKQSSVHMAVHSTTQLLFCLSTTI